jgi:hypothetical protein
MPTNIRELKTNKTLSREGMLTYLDDLKKKVEAHEIESLIVIFGDSESLIRSQVIGDISFTDAIGMIDTAKMAFQLSHFYGDDDNMLDDS